MTPRPTSAVLLLGLALAACNRAPVAPPPATPAASATTSVATAASATTPAANDETAQEQKNLATFDDLDFNVYSHQKWDELKRSHADDITVHWPDGRVTHGMADHVADLKQQFVFAPDTRITSHPIKIAQGDYTAVSGVMEGTFSQPMPVPGGKPIPPTNKPFKIDMVTIGRWKDGVMEEEWLMWDNQAFMKQIGLVK